MRFAKVAVWCFGCAEVVSMNLPIPIFSKNEGPSLAVYHAPYHDVVTGPSCHGVFISPPYFMPKSEEEFTALYNLYVSGKVGGKIVSPLEYLWMDVTGNIRRELTCRCKDGNKSVIDEYLLPFRSFIEVSESFCDQSFLELLYNSSSYSLHRCLRLFIINLEQDIKETPKLTRESIYLPYAVSEIDKILNASRNFQDVKLAEYYRRYHLTDEFRNSPEYQAMYGVIVGTFEEGVSLTDLCTQE
jgi:hypothetical protein